MFIKRIKWFKKKNKCNSEYEFFILLEYINNDELADEESEQITHWIIENEISDEKYEILTNQKTMYNTNIINNDLKFNYYDHDDDNIIKSSRLNYLLRKFNVINNNII